MQQECPRTSLIFEVLRSLRARCRNYVKSSLIELSSILSLTGSFDNKLDSQICTKFWHTFAIRLFSRHGLSEHAFTFCQKSKYKFWFASRREWWQRLLQCGKTQGRARPRGPLLVSTSHSREDFVRRNEWRNDIGNFVLGWGLERLDNVDHIRSPRSATCS